MADTKYNSIRPGELWLDTDGNPIQAHGGGIIYINDTFYWYGENKEKSKPGSGIWHWGVNCYSSKDMYNWKYEGIIVPPTTEDDKDPLHYTQCMDRPHIIYNDRTSKFVMWIKVMNKEAINNQQMVVLTADNILGPYTRIRAFHPLGMNSGDFDLVKNPSDGKAYIFFDRIHSEMICADLTDDYLDVTGFYSVHMPNVPPFVREAPAFFERKNKKYLFTSAITGYFPNPTETDMFDCFHLPMKKLENPHRGAKAANSCFSQISAVFKYPKADDLYIAIADRWLIDVPPELDYLGITAGLYGDGTHPVIMEEDEYIERAVKFNRPDTRDTSKARYVWLPIRFEANTPIIEWYDEWKIEDFC